MPACWGCGDGEVVWEEAWGGDGEGGGEVRSAGDGAGRGRWTRWGGGPAITTSPAS